MLLGFKKGFVEILGVTEDSDSDDSEEETGEESAGWLLVELLILLLLGTIFKLTSFFGRHFGNNRDILSLIGGDADRCTEPVSFFEQEFLESGEVVGVATC